MSPASRKKPSRPSEHILIDLCSRLNKSGSFLLNMLIYLLLSGMKFVALYNLQLKLYNSLDKLYNCDIMIYREKRKKMQNKRKETAENNRKAR